MLLWILFTSKENVEFPFVSAAINLIRPHPQVPTHLLRVVPAPVQSSQPRSSILICPACTQGSGQDLVAVHSTFSPSVCCSASEHMCYSGGTQESAPSTAAPLVVELRPLHSSWCFPAPRTHLPGFCLETALLSLLCWAASTTMTASTRVKWWENREQNLPVFPFPRTIIPTNRRIPLQPSCQCHCCLHPYSISQGPG